MKKLLILLCTVLFIFAGCDYAHILGGTASASELPDIIEQEQASFEVGEVTIISEGNLYEPAIHFLHGASYFGGMLMSASGISFELWLENNFDEIPVLQYSPNLQVSLEGVYGEVVTHIQEHAGLALTAIGIPAEDFTGGTAYVSLPDEAGTYLIYFDVRWSGDGNDFALQRYVFKVVR